MDAALSSLRRIARLTWAWRGAFAAAAALVATALTLFGKDTESPVEPGSRGGAAHKAIKTTPKAVLARRGDNRYVIEMDLLSRNDRIFSGLLPLI
jgi:hypothetical protein